MRSYRVHMTVAKGRIRNVHIWQHNCSHCRHVFSPKIQSQLTLFYISLDVTYVYVSVCVSISHCSSKLASHWHFYPHFVAFVLLKQRFYFVNIFCFLSVSSRQSKRIRNILIEHTHTHTDREMNKLKLGLLQLVKNRSHRCGTISSFNCSPKFCLLLFIIWVDMRGENARNIIPIYG